MDMTEATVKSGQSAIRLRVKYDGVGPVHWSGGAGDFGLQDKVEDLLQPRPDSDGVAAFDFSLEVKPEGDGPPVFTGPFAHGTPSGRFLYLSWREPRGGFAQRLKLPLGSISWEQIRQALDTGAPLVCVLVDKHPKATTTGANIGGTREVVWKLDPRP